jgi:hypothetical protein
VRVFFSHSTTDREIAELLSDLLHGVFGDSDIEVQYSSDQDAGRGIQPGAEWLPWITTRIRQTDKTYVLLTPSSMGKPWVLWESGAAAGVAMATERTSPVVPITFGISDDDVPSPLRSAQLVHGDSMDDDGIARLLQAINQDLPVPLGRALLDSSISTLVPPYLEGVKAVLERSAPIAHPLDSVPQRFAAADLAGLWVTVFTFTSVGETAFHADVVDVTLTTERQLRAVTSGPEPRTAERQRPYRSLVEARLADRHLVGTWRNLSDDRYFGSIHLAVKTGQTLMVGHYTSYNSDEEVGTGPWRWARLDPATTQGVDFTGRRLRNPEILNNLLCNHHKHAALLGLNDVTEGT